MCFACQFKIFVTTVALLWIGLGTASGDNLTTEEAAMPWSRPAITSDRDLVIELIDGASYPVEQHEITTGDGYKLKLHRIPDPYREEAEPPTSGRNGLNPYKGAVLLVHGLFSTGADFVVTGPDTGLAYVLADAGYDVWLANVRGSRFSRKHRKLTAQAADFWDFSFHEIGFFDIPAIVDHILSVTDERQLFYIGHNQGMTALLVCLAEHPQYNDKIQHAIGLATIAFLGRGQSPVIKRLAQATDQLRMTLSTLNVHEITPSTDAIRFLSSTVCAGESNGLCAEMLRGLFGHTVDHARNLLPNIVDNLLSSISSKQLIHIGQLVQSQKFQQFDYKNYYGNMKRYGSGNPPPSYNLSQVVAPISLFHGAADFITSTKDAYRLRGELQNLKHFFEFAGMTHVDFVYSDDLYQRVHSKIITIFNRLREY